MINDDTIIFLNLPNWRNFQLKNLRNFQFSKKIVSEYDSERLFTRISIESYLTVLSDETIILQEHSTLGDLQDPLFTSFHFLSDISSISRSLSCALGLTAPINLHAKISHDLSRSLSYADRSQNPHHCKYLTILSRSHQFGVASWFSRNGTARYPYESGVATQGDLDSLEGPRVSWTRGVANVGERTDRRTEHPASVGGRRCYDRTRTERT